LSFNASNSQCMFFPPSGRQALSMPVFRLGWDDLILVNR
jgi:hypothetical protein